MKILQRSILIVLMVLLSGCSAANKEQMKTKMISEQEAIKIATDDADGFLGTWIHAELKNNKWHVSSKSKSTKPPMYYIIDGNTGEIKLKLDNSDDPKQQKLLLNYNSK